MKKILVMRPKIGFGIGGAEYHAAKVVEGLLNQGFRIGIIAHTVSFPKEMQKEMELYLIKLKGFGSILKHLLFIYQARCLLKKINSYKLISFFRYPFESDLFIMCDPLVAHLINLKKPLLANLRPRYKLLLSLEKKALKHTKRAISLSSFGKTLIKKYYPFFYEKTFICYRGMDFSKFNPDLKSQKDDLRRKWGFSKEDFLILFVGYDTKRKGLHLLFKILPELPEKVKLLVAGAEGKNTERIHYLGKIKNVRELYALTDLFVLPTLYDPSSLATLEALASGTPVITTPNDGASEWIKEGLNGFISERNPLSLKSTIIKALNTTFDPQKIYESIKELTWENYVNCLLSYLEL